MSIAGTLVLEGVHHDYDGIAAVCGVDITVGPGEILCLLGESGCGKTTLLRLAAGIERPTEGRILLDDLEIAGPSRFVQPEKRGVGLMFQDHALFPHLTVLANVMYGLSALRRKDAAAEARRYLERVGLAEFADDYPHMLSGGQQQRVALARALAPRPRVLLMDEPFSGLDRRLRASLREDINEILRNAHATTIMVTHDPEEAMLMGDRIALMRAGRLEQIATPEELYCRPNSLYAAHFISDLLEVPAVVADGEVQTPLGRIAAPNHADGAAVIVGIRPRGLTLNTTGLEPDHMVTGRVVHKRFLGEMDEITVELPGIDRPFPVRVRSAHGIEVGAQRNLGLDPRQVVILPQDTI